MDKFWNTIRERAQASYRKELRAQEKYFTLLKSAAWWLQLV